MFEVGTHPGSSQICPGFSFLSFENPIQLELGGYPGSSLVPLEHACDLEPPAHSEWEFMKARSTASCPKSLAVLLACCLPPPSVSPNK